MVLLALLPLLLPLLLLFGRLACIEWGGGVVGGRFGLEESSGFGER